VADPAVKPRILVIDTENRTASLYADRYKFQTIHLAAPYTPERYKKAMYKAVEKGFDWLIVDSISHEWIGEGGMLAQKDKLDLQPGSNGFTNWARLTPDHDSFIEFIKQVPVHTICTLRNKQKYVLETNNKGKQVPRKVGMEPQQRDGVEYEFTLIFDLEMPSHMATPSKNRTGLFAEDPVNLKDPQVAHMLREWLESGAMVEAPEFKPDLGTKVMHQSGRVETVARSTQRQGPTPAVKPNLISVKQKQDFWTVARGHEKSDEDIRIYLHETFKIGTSAEIPAASFEAAIEWAKTPLPMRLLAPGEERAREAAKLLGVSEADLQYELSTCFGDWEKVYSVLNNRADEEDAALRKAENAKAS
jgi:hypothetical protein